MANTFNVFEIKEYCQQQLNDPNAAWLSAVAIQQVIDRHIVTPETTFYFYLDTTGHYSVRGALGESGAILFKSITTPFTATSTTCTFELDCRGTMHISAGTDIETSPVSVLGATVDIGKVMFDLLNIARTQIVKDMPVSMSADGFSANPVMPEDRFQKVAEWWRGFC